MPITVTSTEVVISGYTSFVGTADAVTRVVYQPKTGKKIPNDLKEALGSPQTVIFDQKYGTCKLVVKYEKKWVGQISTDPPRHHGGHSQKVSLTSELMMNILDHAKSQGVCVEVIVL